MKIQEKRNVRGYKVKDSVYKKAVKQAGKDKKPLATQIEEWVTAYAHFGDNGIAQLMYDKTN